MKSICLLIIVTFTAINVLANEHSNKAKNTDRLKNMSAAARPQKKITGLNATVKVNEAIVVKNDTLIAYKPVFVEKKLKLPTRETEITVEASSSIKP